MLLVTTYSTDTGVKIQLWEKERGRDRGREREREPSRGRDSQSDGRAYIDLLPAIKSEKGETYDK